MSKLSDAIGAFTTIPNTIIALIPAIGPEAFTLFSYLRFRAHGESGLAFPSYETIQKDTGLHPRKIAESIRVLEAHELMSREKRFGHSTLYTLRLPRPPSPSTIGSAVLPMVAQQSFQWWKTNKIESNQIESNKIDINNGPPEPETEIEQEQSETRGLISAELAAIVGDVEEAMGQLKPAQLERIADLWDEFPYLGAHEHAFNVTRKHADFFNLKYYEACLVGYVAQHPEVKQNARSHHAVEHSDPSRTNGRDRRGTRAPAAAPETQRQIRRAASPDASRGSIPDTS